MKIKSIPIAVLLIITMAVIEATRNKLHILKIESVHISIFALLKYSFDNYIYIIIMIILAGAIILSLSKDNVIAKAKLGKESTDFSGIKEMVDLAKSNELYPGAPTFTSGDVTIPSTYSNEISVLNSGQIIIKGLAPGTTSKITDISNAVDKLGAVYIPYGFVASSVTGEMSKNEGLVIYEGTVSNPDVTIVNQFVWVPVENYSQFVRENFHTSATVIFTTVAKTPSQYFEKQPTVGGTDEVSLMYASVQKYHGFYIARYEASDAGGGVVASKQNKSPYVNIKWGGLSSDTSAYDGAPGLDTDTTGAVYKTRAMYPVGGGTGAVSTFIYGVQWDAVMRWYKASGINVQNSTDLGNYSGSVINTGLNPAYRSNNIYDMAGNVFEWTMEACGTGSRVVRGGYFGSLGAFVPASFRFSLGPVGSYDNIGFRSALYIK